MRVLTEEEIELFDRERRIPSMSTSVCKNHRQADANIAHRNAGYAKASRMKFGGRARPQRRGGALPA